MAEAARVLDTIDLGHIYTAEEAQAYEARFAGVDAPEMLATLIPELTPRLAAVSSFGAESAVLLHMVAEIDRDVPVIFTNTQKIFGETLAYRDELSERLGLTDLRVYRPDPRLLAAKDGTGLQMVLRPRRLLRPAQGRAACRRALAPFDAWISGRKGFQAGTRQALPRFEIDEGRLKINPLADWPKAKLDAYFAQARLPRHPLEAQGYPSIGCAPCTSESPAR